jgi:tetratricopeptide (TPR) repeat protein
MEGGALKTRLGVMVLAVAVVAGSIVLANADEPMFVRWLVVDDPGDETIRDYWQRAERDELDPPALVDLGTMLFYRGYPKDAIGLFQRALKLDPDLYEAWFRIGLVEHSEGDLNNARQAYRRCLKKLTGHGWCNFYLGLLEEQLGHGSDAMYYYRRAIKFAPELADPKINPEVMASKLMLGVQLQDQDRRKFKSSLPMPYLEPGKVARVRRQYEPTPTPEPEPEPSEESAAAEAPPRNEPRSVEPQPQPTQAQPVRPPRPQVPRRGPTRTPFE